LVSGNWKMHHDHLEAIATVQRLLYRLEPKDYEATEVGIHPPFTAIRSVQVLLDQDGPPLRLGAQNCHWEPKGAFTGEVSAPMLAKLGVSYVIVGHSERRLLFGETDEIVRAKLGAVWREGMTPILCVGETEGERDKGLTREKVTSQVRAALEGTNAGLASRLVIAYEPIWAIGTGRAATPDDAQDGAATVRAAVASVWGSEAAAKVRVQYGGSVSPKNALELLAAPDVDGALVGGASLDADSFAEIVSAARTVAGIR
jgi:triosephosphate isomerase